MDQDEDSRGLLKSILGYFARRPSENTVTSSLARSQAWVRADAYLQHESDELGELDLEQVDRTLNAFENLVECEYDVVSDFVSVVQNSTKRPTNAHTLPH